MDRRVVPDKSDFPMTNFGEPPGQSLDCRKERLRSECPVAAFIELDPVNADAHQHGEILLPVCGDRLDGGFAALGPCSERGCVEVEARLVEEPDAVIGDPVDLDRVLVALLDALSGEDDAGL